MFGNFTFYPLQVFLNLVEIVSSCIFAEQIRQIWIHATHMLLHVSTFLLNILLPIYPTVLVLGIIFVFVEYPTNRSRATQYSCWLALYPGTLVAPLMLSPKLPQNTCCLWALIFTAFCSLSIFRQPIFGIWGFDSVLTFHFGRSFGW